MIASIIIQDNTNLRSCQHNSLNPPTTHSPRLTGKRLNHSNAPEGSKHFKQNFNGSKIRFNSDDVKEDIRSSVDTSKRNYLSSEIKQNSVDNQRSNGNNGNIESAQSEGSGVGIIEEGDSEEGYYQPLADPKFNFHKSPELNSTASTSTTPSSILVEDCELIADLDLGQDCLYDDSSESQDFICPVALEGPKWNEFLDCLKQEKGYTFKTIKHVQKGIRIVFKCLAGHNFAVSSSQKVICHKCDTIIAKCSEYAKLNHGILYANTIGKLITKKYEDYLEFECENHHIWKIKYSKQ